MRLVNTTTLQLEVVDENSCNPPPYAALSYAWGTAEPLYDQFQTTEKDSRRSTFPKLYYACFEARQKWDLEWIWVDTVCIDRSSSTELSEAINLMFQWYRKCEVCLVYLDDLGPPDSSDSLELNLAQCTWMTRVWSLQELIAPKEVLFYNKEWTLVGTKASLVFSLSKITTVDVAVLEDSECIPDFSIGKRMSWAARRSARRVEDIAYSLLGIFSVNIPIVYGEGTKAFLRLQEEILRNTGDASLFAWQHSTVNHRYRGMLAQCPSEFAHFTNYASSAPWPINGDIQITSVGIVVSSAFAVQAELYDFILRLSSSNTNKEDMESFTILLKKWKGEVVRLDLPMQHVFALTRLHKGEEDIPSKICIWRDLDARTSQIIERSFSKAGSYEHPLEETGSDTNVETSGQVRVEGTSGKNLVHDSTTRPTWNSAFYDRTIAPDSTTTACSIAVSAFGSNRRMSCDFSDTSHAPKSDKIPSTINHYHRDHRGSEASYISSQCKSSPSSPFDNGELTQDSSSEEDYMYLFESPSEDLVAYDLSPEFAKLTDELTGRALKNFVLSILQHQTAAKRLKAGDLTPQTRKRLKVQCFDTWINMAQHEDESDDDTVIVGYPRPEKLVWACPFYARNPEGYQDCLIRVELQGIKDLTQHLWTCHRRPIFCPTCRTQFSTSVACNDHIRSRICSLQEKEAPEGMTETQMQILARRQNPSMKDELQWRAIWSIVYPDIEVPSQPYLTGDVESVVCVAREYWRRDGQGIISDFLKSKEVRNHHQHKNGELDLAALYQNVLNQMLEKLVASFKEDSEEPRDNTGEKIVRLGRVWSQT